MRAVAIIITLISSLFCVKADALDDFLMSASASRHDIVDFNSAKNTLDSIPQPSIAGIYRFSDSDGIFAIISLGSDNRSLMIALDSPQRNIIPGTVIGAIRPTGKKNVFDVRLFRKINGEGVQSSPVKIHATLSDSNFLCFRAVKNGIRINPWRLLPYMFRGVITPRDNHSDEIDGAIRIYSPYDYKPLTPRYL